MLFNLSPLCQHPPYPTYLRRPDPGPRLDHPFVTRILSVPHSSVDEQRFDIAYRHRCGGDPASNLRQRNLHTAPHRSGITHHAFKPLPPPHIAFFPHIITAPMSASPNKRQRLSGSFSPASPPYHLAKTADVTKAPVFQPHTPTSPPHMSSSTQINGTASSTATQRSETSPPSSAAMSSQISQHPINTTTNTLPTPASSVAGGASFATKDIEGDARMTDELLSASLTIGDDILMSDSDLQRHTNHNRQDDGSLASASVGYQRLNVDLGSLFKLCENRKVPFVV